MLMSALCLPFGTRSGPTLTKSPTFTDHPQSICPLKRVAAIKPLNAHGGAAIVGAVIAFNFHNNAPNQMMGGFYHVTYFHRMLRSAKMMHATAAIIPPTLINIVICSS
jgi:hypothetical protein